MNTLKYTLNNNKLLFQLLEDVVPNSHCTKFSVGKSVIARIFGRRHRNTRPLQFKCGRDSYYHVFKDIKTCKLLKPIIYYIGHRSLFSNHRSRI